jgi:hypothetical protein
MKSLLARLAASVAAAALAAGCAAGKAAAVRNEYLKSQLDPFVYAKPLPDVWPDVLGLLHEKDYPLVGSDAVAVGQSENWASNFLSPGFETRSGSAQNAAGTGFLPSLFSRSSSKGEDTWRYLKTGMGRDSRLFRADGVAEGEGCRVTFTAYNGRPGEIGVFSEDTARRDFQMELDLVRRVEPAAAARIEAGMP